MLHSQRPLLIPRPRQTERFVPSGQLDGTGTGFLRQTDTEHFQHDALDVVFRLGFGQAQGVDLHAVAEAAHVFALCAITFLGQRVPHLAERPHLAHFFDEANTGVDEERNPPDHLFEAIRADLAGIAHRVHDRDGGGQGVGEFLSRSRSGFLQVVATDIGWVPFGDVLDRVGDDVGG